MSFTSLCRFYLNKKTRLQNTIDFYYDKCKIIEINDNMTCIIEIKNKKYNLYLKGVPKKKIINRYFKYLCSNSDIFYVKTIEKRSKSNNIIGYLFNKDKNNINILLYKRFKNLKNKYISDNIYFRSKLMTPYRTDLYTIYEEDESNI